METSGLMLLLHYFLAPYSDDVPGTLCRNHSIEYKTALKNGTYWAIKMWDSKAKLQTGLLTGNINSLGNYDECIRVQSTKFTGKYCLARFDVPSATAAEDALGTLFQEVMDEEHKIHVGLGSLLSRGLRWGYCIPSSCDSHDLAIGLSNYLSAHMKDVNVTALGTDCSVKEEAYVSLEVSALGMLAVVVFGTLTIFIVASTLYDLVTVYQESRFRDDPEAQPLLVPAPVAVQNVNVPENSRNQLNLSQEIQSGRARPPSPEEIKLQIHTGKSSSSSSKEISGTPQVIYSKKQIQKDEKLPSASSATPNPEERRETSPEALDQLRISVEPHRAATQMTPQISPVEMATRSETDIMSTFSVFTNGSILFSFQNKQSSLSTLDGIKVISLVWVMLGQSYFVTSSLPALNYISIKEMSLQWPAVFVLNTQLAIDSFIVCSGILTAYHFMRDIRMRELRYRNQRMIDHALAFTHYFSLAYFHRYIRLTPTIAFLILLQLTVLNHVGSGPFWGTGNAELTDVCRDSWWETLLYIQNVINPERMCLPHSWYMMVDMQLYIIAPFFLLCFIFTDKMSSILICIIFMYLGITASFLISYIKDITPGVLIGSLEDWHVKTQYDFVATHTRLAPWLIGMVTGYLLYYYRKTERERPSMKKWILCIGWVVAPLLMGFSLFGLLRFQREETKNPKWMNAAFNSLFRPLWALGLAWIIVASETNHGGIIQSMLTMRIFQPLSRLTYCMYLVHLPLMMYRSFMISVPIHIDTWTGLSYFFGDVTASLHYAVLLALVVEIPVIRLYKAIALNLNCPLRLHRVRVPSPMFVLEE